MKKVLISLWSFTAFFLIFTAVWAQSDEEADFSALSSDEVTLFHDETIFESEEDESLSDDSALLSENGSLLSEVDYFSEEDWDFLFPGFSLFEPRRDYKVTNLTFMTSYFELENGYTDSIVTTNFDYVRPKAVTIFTNTVTNEVIEVEADWTNYIIVHFFTNLNLFEFYSTNSNFLEFILTKTNRLDYQYFTNYGENAYFDGWNYYYDLVYIIGESNENNSLASYSFSNAYYHNLRTNTFENASEETNQIGFFLNLGTRGTLSPLSDVGIDLREEIYEGIFSSEYRIENPFDFLDDQTILSDEKEEFSNRSSFGYDEELFDEANLQKRLGRMEFTAEEESHFNIGFEEWETKVIVSGNVQLSLNYGWDKYDDGGLGAGNSGLSLSSSGFSAQQSMDISVVGKFGDRIGVEIDQSASGSDTTSLFDENENTYEIWFEALEDDTGILRELRAGNVTLELSDNASYFIDYSGVSEENYGVKVVLEKNNWKLQSVLSLSTSLQGSKTFTGGNVSGEKSLKDVSFKKLQYFILPDTGIDSGTLKLYRYTGETNTADLLIDGTFFERIVEGVDFTADYYTGMIYLEDNLDDDESLIALYTALGADPTMDYPEFIATDPGSGTDYLYLWKATQKTSPYLHCGFYSLGTTDLDLSDGFNLEVYLTADDQTRAEISFDSDEYEIHPLTGIIEFKESHPFAKGSAGEGFYSNVVDMDNEDSIYTLKLDYSTTVDSYSLDFGIIPGTETVTVGGRELSASEYTIVYTVGELIFNVGTEISSEDTIVVTYEYVPFFVGSQKFGMGLRFDYKPSDVFNLGSTMIYNISQRSGTGAPEVGDTPENSFIADVDVESDVAEILNLNSDFDWTLSGEAALSIVDENSVNYATIDTFESSGDSYSVTANETKWVLSAPTTNLSWMDYDNRGQLLYKDYRNYRLDDSYDLLNYSAALEADQIFDYADKCGPYLVRGGHLSAAEYPNLSQTSIVVDFDFSGAKQWVGMATSIAGPAGENLSEYNRVEVWAKLQSDEDGDGSFSESGGSSVEIYLAAGIMNEDSDGDGLLDYETSTAQGGYQFNVPGDPNTIETYVGSGRRDEGDGVVQTEDLNGDGTLSTNEQVILIPGELSSENTLTEGDWQKLTFRLTELTTEEIEALQYASSVMVYIQQSDGTRGRVIIDSVEFKEVNWEDKLVDGIDYDESLTIQGTAVSVYNNVMYSENRFYDLDYEESAGQERAVIFEKLHGPKSVTEAQQMNEVSLELEYDLTDAELNTNLLSQTVGSEAFLVDEQTKSLDISHYRYLNFFIFIPETYEDGSVIKQSGDSYSNEAFVLEFGSSKKSSFRWEIPLSEISHDEWLKVQIDLSSGGNLSIDGQSYEVKQMAYPDFSDINYIRLGATTTDSSESENVGLIWVNEMYVSLDDVAVGYGFYVGMDFEYDEPILKIGNFELLGPVDELNVDYVFQNKKFIESVGSDYGSFSHTYSLDFSSELLEDIEQTFTINGSQSGTDTDVSEVPLYMQNFNEGYSLEYSLDFDMNRDYIPTFFHKYTENLSNSYSYNLDGLSDDTNDELVNNIDRSFTSVLDLQFEQDLPLDKDGDFILSPSVSWEESFELLDYSETTNISETVFITNDSVKGERTLEKELNTSLAFYLNDIDLIFSYDKKRSQEDIIKDENGYRLALANMMKKSIFERYADRIDTLVNGFGYEDEPFPILENDLISANLDIDEPKGLKFLEFSAESSFGRYRDGVLYDDDGELSSRQDSYQLNNGWDMELGPPSSKKDPVLPDFSFENDRQVVLSYDSLTSSVGPNDALQLSDIFYIHPLFFNGLFMGDTARSNALVYVNEFNTAELGSDLSLEDEFEMKLIFPDYENVLDYILPKKYTYTTEQLTTRSSSSMLQTRSDAFKTSFLFELTELMDISTNNLLRPSDIQVDLEFQKEWDYNSCLEDLTWSIELDQTVYWGEDNNFVLGYDFEFTKSLVSDEFADFSALNLNSDAGTNNSDSFAQSHAFELTMNWYQDDLGPVNFGFFEIDFGNTDTEHQETLTFDFNTLRKEGTFAAYDYEIFEVLLEHSTEFEFTDVFSAEIEMEMNVNRQVNVSTDNLREKYDAGFGFLIGATIMVEI